MQCDICGKETKVYLTEIEGAKLYVCMDCNPSRKGLIARPQRKKFVHNREQFIPKFKMRKQEPFDLNNYDLVDDYALQIRNLREKQKKTIEDFAKGLFVTDSYLRKVEQGKLKPSPGLLLKLYERYAILLVNKNVKKETSGFQKRKFAKNKDFKRRNFKPRFDNAGKYKHEKKFVGSKEIYVSENTNSDTFKSVEHNNKKKIVL